MGAAAVVSGGASVGGYGPRRSHPRQAPQERGHGERPEKIGVVGSTAGIKRDESPP